ncbi:MAG: phosphomethylpyrimidine kinase, partial [Clostridiaceae bacterium]|nr:phosphomethylpyrimidine kinase [Clostridiaceae bacterium]
MKKKVLLINDMPGYGKVALSAMFPILSHMG